MNFFKGTFTANTSTGNQTVSGIGFTPKAVILWTSYQTGTGFTDGYQYQIGLCDGTNQNSWAVISDEGAPNDTNRTKTESHWVQIANVAGTDIRVGDIVSFGSGQFVINWTTADASAAIFHFVAFGGSDLSAAVGNDTFAGTFSGTNTNYDAVTFSVSAAFYVCCVTSGDACNGPTLGWVAAGPPNSGAAVTQGHSEAQVRDAQSTSICGRRQGITHCAAIFSSTSQSIADDFHYTGFGIIADTAPVAGTANHFLALGNISSKSAAGLQPTSTGAQSVTGLNFSPKGIMFLSVGQTSQTTVQTEARFNLGGADGTNQGWAWTGAVNNVNPIRTAIGHSTTNVITCSTPAATGSSTTTESQASLTSLDGDGFTLNWGTADATQREYLWIAFGDASGSPGTGGQSAYTFA